MDELLVEAISTTDVSMFGALADLVTTQEEASKLKLVWYMSDVPFDPDTHNKVNDAYYKHCYALEDHKALDDSSLRWYNECFLRLTSPD